MNNIKKLIEKKSKIQLNDFPKEDFQEIEKYLKLNNNIEVWLEKGMGRYYLTSCLIGKHKSPLPIQQKLCQLKNKTKIGDTKVEIEYKTIDNQDEWKKIKIPLKFLYNGYDRTAYTEENGAESIVIKFKYNIFLIILLKISDFLYNNFKIELFQEKIKLYDINNKEIKEGMKVKKGSKTEIVATHPGGRYPFVYFPYSLKNPEDEIKIAKEWEIIKI